MKSLKIASIFILSLFVFTITSCDDEPLEGEFLTDDDGSEVSCVQATQNLASASATYGTTSAGDANYSLICNAYAVALQDMINACGDDTGGIQTLLDALDCPAISEDCLTAQSATAIAETAYNADTTDTNLCLAYKTALENEITQCGDADGSLQTIIDGLDCDTVVGSDADYWPRAIGNSWTYNGLNGEIETYTILNTETIDGNEYYAFDELFDTPSWLRKSGTSYYVRSIVSGEVGGIEFTSTPIELKMIKDDAVVGETWQSEVSYTITYSGAIPDVDVVATYDYEMMERNISRTVEGVDYTDVIHIENVVSAVGSVVTVQYYYAKDVGMIEYITDAGTATLTDYSLN
ncbi:hypothetical protein FG167_15025 [Lacinutrix sp. WUR7]|uniref:hypothetical protein n=1 Tax=Lacinutrix sp. WUR7 TaxID=2653681 RepID=UPI00193E39FB|nr:hypothetical protein [Lacinutrix sp. WUR7]QRM90490.1 hypothetical protein FG167_15025 [Lacinutrix sp. WUR7]